MKEERSLNPMLPRLLWIALIVSGAFGIDDLSAWKSEYVFDVFSIAMGALLLLAQDRPFRASDVGPSELNGLRGLLHGKSGPDVFRFIVGRYRCSFSTGVEIANKVCGENILDVPQSRTGRRIETGVWVGLGLCFVCVALYGLAEIPENIFGGMLFVALGVGMAFGLFWKARRVKSRAIDLSRL